MGNRRKPHRPTQGIEAAAAAVLDDGLFTACCTMVPRLGAEQLQLRYSDDESPLVWIAVAGFGGRRFEVGAGPSPEKALFRMLEALVDGGSCTHCKRPTGITRDFSEQPAQEYVCWYQYDPELKTFRRGCE